MKFLSMAILALTFVACDKSNNGGPNSSKANFYLTDAPGDFDAVNVEIEKVEVKTDASGFTEIAINPGVYDLLQLTNGVDTLLGEVELTGDTLKEIRLVLGANNTVVVDGETKSLKVPSGQSSGLKIKVNHEITAGLTYDFTLDFDAGQSVKERGNGEYILKPVIRVFSDRKQGATVDGDVQPDSSGTSVMMISQFNDTLSTYTDEDGSFKFKNVSEGIYTVKAQHGEMVGIKTGVAINANAQVDIGTIVLQ
ncbi:DUF4382 domain-containing protein [Luteibaculum oceani]|nr:DUF4382 domain-containing protein [Luteibaculum oceani]